MARRRIDARSYRPRKGIISSKNTHKRNGTWHWMDIIQKMALLNFRSTILIGAFNIFVLLASDLLAHMHIILRGTELAIIGTISEFGFFMDFLDSIHFEAPILLLFTLIADNLKGIYEVMHSQIFSIKTLIILSFRSIDMGRDILELHDNYGYFRLNLFETEEDEAL